jgi:ATP-dependent helicase/nuclease subunit B
MGLTLLAGPANAGKVASLLERYLAAFDEDPFLIVPNRSDVDRVERDLLTRAGALMSGEIGTFDDLFEQLARGPGAQEIRPVATDLQRHLVLRRVVAKASLNGLAPSARFAGFPDALAAAIAELEAGLLDPADLDGELARLYAAYRAELDSLGLSDRDLDRRLAAERVESELDAWQGRPVLAYGFEDLTGAEWALIHALSGRADVAVSLPYEPGRPAFASLERTAGDLQQLAGDRIEELPPRSAEFAHPALAHLDRRLFADGQAPSSPPLGGAVRFLEGAGARGTLELVGDHVLALLRDGTPADEIALVCPSLDRWRGPIETALGTLAIPFQLGDRIALSQTPFGQALLALLRFVWLERGRRELYTFLRSPFSGVPRSSADYLEGRLRGRAVSEHARVEEETLKLRGQPIPALDTVRGADTPLEAVRALARLMVRSAYGLESPPVGEAAQLDLRAYEAVATVANELEAWSALAGPVDREDVLHSLERALLRRRAGDDAGRVAVLDLMRARTRRFEVVFVLGLEQGSLPRRTSGSPFLDEDARRELDRRHRRARLDRPDQVARDRYLFYTACTRAKRRLYLVRESASDEGSPREPSPFWDETRLLFDREDVDRWTERRALSALTWPLEHAPTERERLRALAALYTRDVDAALGLARANGWERRLERAESAFQRPTRLRHPSVLEELRARGTFGVTELEAFADCSSIWLLGRVVDPRRIDGEVDAKLRGQIAHQALYRFFSGLPKRLGAERVDPELLDDALIFLHECLDEALRGGVRLELAELDRRELEQSLRRDLEHFVRQEAESPSPLVPRRFEVSFGSERSAPELQRGLPLDGVALTGKIDRIDLDPFSARGIVQDYKSGATAHSASKIENELRLQIPLYMLVLRDLIGIEPLGGLYRALAGKREARGILRADAQDDGVPGYAKSDYLDEDEFWGQVERARAHALSFVDRIKAGDVKHDPKGGFPCPTWCDLWSMCRVRRT